MMNIADRLIGHEEPPYIIAEIGVNHDGRVERALRLIDAAAEAGADAVKFQFFEADLLLGRSAPLAAYQSQAGETDAREMLRRLELPREAYADLLSHALSRRLHAIVTVFSLEHVDVAAALAWDAFKVASPDLVNRPLIGALASTGRPLILSTGGASAEEVEHAARWTLSSDVGFMQCVSSYPALDDHAALGGIEAVRALTGRPVGYSDHTQGVETGGLAVAAGACMLEKHLTWSRGAAGPDHEASLEPDRFARYVDRAHRAYEMVGERVKRVLDVERGVRMVTRQSVAAARDLPAGRPLEAGDLTLRRPGDGLPAEALPTLEGRVPSRAIVAGEILRESDLADASGGAGVSAA
jgi:N-acetylneuraminate synthase/N,N'-diacetyllegionaminate synthase